jgi:hypothetical protein
VSLDCKNVKTCNRDARPFIVVNFPRAGRVGEWLKPADCKSAAPCGLRRFESSPVHQFAQRSVGQKFDEARSKHVSNVREARGTSRPVLHEKFRAWVAQLVERVLGKDEVTSSILVPGSRVLSCQGWLEINCGEGF